VVVELLDITEVLESRLVGRQAVFEDVEDLHTAVVLGWPLVDIS
jgi:hypothetical protein